MGIRQYRYQRHASYVDHSVSDLLRQRIFQTACGYADGNDANHLRHDPVFKLAAERAPLNESWGQVFYDYIPACKGHEGPVPS